VPSNPPMRTGFAIASWVSYCALLDYGNCQCPIALHSNFVTRLRTGGESCAQVGIRNTGREESERRCEGEFIQTHAWLHVTAPERTKLGP